MQEPGRASAEPREERHNRQFGAAQPHSPDDNCRMAVTDRDLNVSVNRLCANDMRGP
jgi:hypothetical protein